MSDNSKNEFDEAHNEIIKVLQENSDVLKVEKYRNIITQYLELFIDPDHEIK